METRRSFIKMLCVLTLADSAVRNGLADPSRPYSAFFDFSGVNTNGDPVLLTLSMQLMNHTGADITNGTVVLRGLSTMVTPYATFSGVVVSAGGQVLLSQQISVPMAEFQRWQTGAPPTAFLQDQAGEHAIEMARGPMGGN